jgi:hypothetical protein
MYDVVYISELYYYYYYYYYYSDSFTNVLAEGRNGRLQKLA